jgi:hypothetical protein
MRTPRGREATELAYKHLNKEFKPSQKGLFWFFFTNYSLLSELFIKEISILVKNIF